MMGGLRPAWHNRCAVVAVDGSNKPKSSPFHHPVGKLVLFRIDGIKLSRIADAPTGWWSRGVAFSRDSKTLLGRNMTEDNIAVIKVAGDKLTDTGQHIAVKGGAAGIRIADLP